MDSIRNSFNQFGINQVKKFNFDQVKELHFGRLNFDPFKMELDRKMLVKIAFGSFLSFSLIYLG